MDTEEILKELAQYMDNDWQSMEGPKLVDIDPIEWLRTHLTASYEQGRRDAGISKEKVVDQLGYLYDIADKIYKENIWGNGDASSDAAQMTALLNGINKHIPFLAESTISTKEEEKI